MTFLKTALNHSRFWAGETDEKARRVCLGFIMSKKSLTPVWNGLLYGMASESLTEKLVPADRPSNELPCNVVKGFHERLSIIHLTRCDLGAIKP